MPNMRIWDRVFTTPKDVTSSFKRGGFSGTAIRPYYVVARLTEMFGPAGEGWTVSVIGQQIVPVGPHHILHVAHVALRWREDVASDHWHVIEALGQTWLRFEKTNGDIVVVEEAPKQSVTDALLKAASMLGIGGDVHSGTWDGSKWVGSLGAKPSKAQAADEHDDDAGGAGDAASADEPSFHCGASPEVDFHLALRFINTHGKAGVERSRAELRRLHGMLAPEHQRQLTDAVRAATAGAAA